MSMEAFSHRLWIRRADGWAANLLGSREATQRAAEGLIENPKAGVLELAVMPAGLAVNETTLKLAVFHWTAPEPRG